MTNDSSLCLGTSSELLRCLAKIPSPEKISVDWLQVNHSIIHFFGLGFIQVKLGESTRMHFYSPELPPFVEFPHNHRYDFVSTIIGGSLTNEIWGENGDGDSYVLEQESCREGEKPESSKREVKLVKIYEKTYLPRETYFMDHHTLHTVRGAGAVTLLARTHYRKEFADVTRPIGTEPVCPFSMKVGNERLWEIVSAMLEQLNKK